MNPHIRIIYLIVCLSICQVIYADQFYVKPQWYAGKSDFREAVVDKNGKLTDSYNRMGSDTVNVFDLNTRGEHSLSIVFNIDNLHNKPHTQYPQYDYDESGKVKRSGSVKRPIYGWVWGMKDMQHYNAIWMRASRSDDTLYDNADTEYCIVTINGNDTIYHEQWRSCQYQYQSNYYNNNLHAIWIQSKNNSAWIGGGLNYEIPWSTVHNIPTFGSLTGLYLGSASKVQIDNVFITVDEKEALRQTNWTKESLNNYFNSSNKLDAIEGFWHFAEDNSYMKKTLLGGDYELAIVANGSNYDIIYLSGAKIYPGKWKEGTVKGVLQHCNNRYYDGYWYDAEGEKVNHVQFNLFIQKLYVNFQSEDLQLSMLPSKHIIKESPNTSSLGTGFALTNDGYIVTNHHVIDKCNEFYIHYDPTLSMQSYSAEVVVSDSIHDLAILRINDAAFTSFGEIPYGFGNGEIRAGEDIFYLGYPKPSIVGFNIKYSMGNVTSTYGYNQHEFTMSVDIDSGSSGSPVFNADGDVTGVVRAITNEGLTRITANFAVKIPYLHRLVEQLPSPITLPQNKIKELSQPDKVEAITPYIFIIEAIGR